MLAPCVHHVRQGLQGGLMLARSRGPLGLAAAVIVMVWGHRGGLVSVVMWFHVARCDTRS